MKTAIALCDRQHHDHQPILNYVGERGDNGYTSCQKLIPEGFPNAAMEQETAKKLQQLITSRLAN
ncbi:MAG TPA: hypothetical protein VNX46_10985 [Candidatus Acidoferrum sp.]|nr:hypothetical protein [Candidatus Acidoferrum sp.]